MLNLSDEIKQSNAYKVMKSYIQEFKEDFFIIDETKYYYHKYMPMYYYKIIKRPSKKDLHSFFINECIRYNKIKAYERIKNTDLKSWNSMIKVNGYKFHTTDCIDEIELIRIYEIPNYFTRFKPKRLHKTRIFF